MIEFFDSFAKIDENANKFEFKLNDQKIENLIDVFQFNIVANVFETFHEFYELRHEIRDKRYILHNMNLAT